MSFFWSSVSVTVSAWRLEAVGSSGKVNWMTCSFGCWRGSASSLAFPAAFFVATFPILASKCINLYVTWPTLYINEDAIQLQYDRVKCTTRPSTISQNLNHQWLRNHITNHNFQLPLPSAFFREESLLLFMKWTDALALIIKNERLSCHAIRFSLKLKRTDPSFYDVTDW